MGVDINDSTNVRIKSNHISNSVSDLLNVIRIFAALSVLVGHGFSFFQVGILKDDTFFPYIQSLAVLVFFILSGFLTDNSLSKKTIQYRYGDFIKGRFKRIYVYYIPALLFIYILDKIYIFFNPEAYLHYQALNITIVIKNLLMIPRMSTLSILGGTQNIFIPVITPLFTNETLGSARPLWTLFIECWMYMFYGYYELVFKRKHERKVVTLDILMIFAFILMFIHLGFESQCCILTFGCGVLVNRSYKKLNASRVTLFVIAFITILLFIIDSLSVRYAYCLQECIFLTLMFYIALAISNTFQKKNTSKILKAMSEISYPLYLIHYSIIEFIIGNFYNWSNKITLVISVIISIIVSTIFYYFVKCMQGIIKIAKIEIMK